jgi:hypothetical protein
MARLSHGVFLCVVLSAVAARTHRSTLSRTLSFRRLISADFNSAPTSAALANRCYRNNPRYDRI